MPTFNGLILTAAEYKVALVANNGVPVILNTLETFDYDTARDEEMIPAIGQVEPIGVKTNFAKYTGSFSLQVGELSSLMRVLGLAEPTQINGATLVLTPTNPLAQIITFSDVQVTKGSTSIKAGEMKTVTSVDWIALKITTV